MTPPWEEALFVLVLTRLAAKRFFRVKALPPFAH